MSDIERMSHRQAPVDAKQDIPETSSNSKTGLFRSTNKPIELEGKTFENANLQDITNEVTVIMPIAGKATRARQVTNDEIPKHLIRLNNGDTILDTITQQLQIVGFRRFVFCVGFLKEQIIDHIEQKAWITNPDTSYDFDETDKLLGPDGTVLHAIGALALKGQAMLIPGDVMLPWSNLVSMNKQHCERGADITFGVTSYVTERTTDVGKIVVEDGTDRLLWGYGRTEKIPSVYEGARNLTSAPSHVISIERFVELCKTYRAHHPGSDDEPLSLRDEMLPWIRTNGGFEVLAYDIEGEVLDLGTPSNIYYGQENWENYVNR